MRGIISYLILFTCLVFTVCSTSCKKDRLLTTGGVLRFSVDTLQFDTVFTAAGSFTTSLKIYNPQNEKIQISSVRLQGGSNSFFHLNVDGYPNSATNITIQPHDSIYVFATVNINPDSANSPFVVEDNLVVTLNGKDYSVPFQAYGQNAHYVVDSVLTTQTWLTDKPYVIVHSAEVDSGETLTIPPGCRIYMHQDSRLFVRGKLIALGTKKDSIIFQGDRLDRSYFNYEGFPGEWGGLYFDAPSKNNQLDYVIIKNCGNSALSAPPAAIEVAPPYVDDPANPQLIMNHTIIQNSLGYGLLCYNARVIAQNSLINMCGAEALGLIKGGDYTINNCTFAIYSTDNINHVDNATPTAAILNYLPIDNTTYKSGNLSATLTNCVVWGTLNDELFCDRKSGATASITLNNCLYKDVDPLDTFVVQNSCKVNQDPLFANPTLFDFHASSATSPMVGNGAIIPSITDDLDGYSRSAPYDIGCYQYHH
ncbi:MAG TPA: hypothetical protein VN721_00495 [Flavipsychrobacter sp.]|nr:hypothetical protein [Flavipsychrobacter sp.]